MTHHYIQAFKQFSGAADSDFEYVVREWGVYFLWDGVTYVVRQDEDLRKHYLEMFEEDDRYEDILSQTEPFLWKNLLTEELNASYTDVMVDVYRHWKLYWNKKRSDFKTEEHYQQLKSESWQDLQFLVQLTRGNLSEMVNAAEEIDGNHLTPIIAYAVRDQYEELDDFLTDCVSTLLDYGDSMLSAGDTFESVEIETEKGPTLFCIYNDNLDFEFLTSEDGLHH